MKSKIISELKNGLGFPMTRGEVAAQEQIKIFRQSMATSKGELRVPTTRGEVAAQEQLRIIGQATGNFVQNKSVSTDTERHRDG